jgi:hypothetical protein
MPRCKVASATHHQATLAVDIGCRICQCVKEKRTRKDTLAFHGRASDQHLAPSTAANRRALTAP